MLVFFIVTACVTILEGTLGAIFWPDTRVGFQAFLSPPLFGALSALSGVVVYSRHELTMKQMAVRMCLQLLLIEAMVFLANILFGDFESFTPQMIVTLAFAIALIYVIVHFVLWINDRNVAKAFNECLRKLQSGYYSAPGQTQ